jgi:hypothetical protein
MTATRPTATGSSGFGALLARLCERRSLDAASLSRRAAAAEPELARVFEGAEPSPALLRRLAPALGLHTADLFVIARAALPADLAPVDVKARGMLPGLMKRAVTLPPAERAELRGLVRSLPRQPRAPEPTAAAAAPPAAAPRPSDDDHPAAVLLRLAGCRNLERVGLAKVFYLLTGRYWSASTYAMVGSGRVELTGDLVADFATVLGISAADLGILTGVAPVPQREPAVSAVDPAALLWDLRSLSAEQVRHVDEVTRARVLESSPLEQP